MAEKMENEDEASFSGNEKTVVRRITNNFSLDSPHQPCGDQPLAISSLLQGLEQGRPHQVLLGITGSGKTFTIANVIAGANRPTLVLAPNKTLAAQLYSEFRRLFPQNAVEYFVSYYDYYQPEAYVPSSDTYIAKDSSINEQIDRLRHSATRSLLERNDVIIVASVSCIYGLGSADAYEGMVLQVEVGQKMPRKAMLRKLVDIHYERNPTSFHRGVFRVRGDVVDIFPAHEEDRGVRIEMFGDEIERICVFDPLRGTVLEERTKMAVFPASHYVTPKEKMERAIEAIREELKHHLKTLDGEGKLLESQRLAQRTQFDLEMMGELGRCKGIENYSRHLSGRNAGEPPPTLIEYFPKNWLCVVDESHIAVPQLGAMYRGDRSRKQTLVEHGFRLPSALDNRPLQFEEFQEHVGQAIYVSATPGEWELGVSGEECVEQIIRPTGLLDPEIEVRPAAHQVDDCLDLIRERVNQDERVLVTVLTKRMAQQLADYFHEVGVKAQYLHSDVKTLERLEILRNLRLGEFDVLVGINLLREGLDLPEVSLVCIMDADKEGFLRNERSLIQTIGRASRNIHGKVILYGDRLTKSMARAVEETRRRREIQERYNQKHGITPETIVRAVDDSIIAMSDADYVAVPPIHKQGLRPKGWSRDEQLVVDQVPSRVANLRKQMGAAAEKLAFEEAARLRDQIHELEQWALEMGEIH